MKSTQSLNPAASMHYNVRTIAVKIHCENYHKHTVIKSSMCTPPLPGLCNNVRVRLHSSLIPRLPQCANESGEAGKIYHMRNTTGRVDLNTFGRTNEFAHTLLMEYTHSVVTALLVTGRNSTMLNNLAVLQAMVSVQTRTFENHTNLLPYPSN